MKQAQLGGEEHFSGRVWPATTERLRWLALLLSGPIGAIVLTALGLWMLAPIFFVPVLFGLRAIGWAEIDNAHLSQRRLIGESTSVAFAEVREVGLGMDQRKGKKWWYPEVATRNGASIKFVALKSRSGKRTISTVEEIFAACLAHMPEEVDDPFTSVTSSADGELEFFLSPGYDAYLRDKAEEPAVEPTAEVVAPIETPRQIPTSARLPHATFCDPESPTESSEDAPDVFTPRALTDRRKTEGLTVVREGFVERSDIDRRAVSAMPAVEIQQPGEANQQPAEPAEPSRGFTSLFKRAA